MLARSLFGRLTLAAAVLFISACSSSGSSQVLKGHLVLGQTMNAFKSCNATQDTWVYGEQQLMGSLQAGDNNLTQEPYQEVFAELEGVSGKPLDCELCQQYPASFKVTAVKQLRVAQPSDCQ